MRDYNFWPKIKKPILALAPMAGFSDAPFRRLVSDFGADVVYSEMASATALFYNSQETLTLLKSNRRHEKKYVVQLFGSKPDHFAVAAQMVTKIIKPAGIDINFGCPVGKVIKQGAGSDLMQNLVKAREVISAVCDNTHLPVSVKIRAKSGDVGALDFIKSIADLPVRAVMIHGRTVKQGFLGEIDYNLIKEAKKYFTGIILANGGINDLAGAKNTLARSGADGLGLARGALGRPWLFKEIKSNKVIDFNKKKLFRLIKKHARLFKKIKGERNMIELRKHFCWYFQGRDGASSYRKQIVKMENYHDLVKILKI